MMLGCGSQLVVLVGAVFLTRTWCLENPESRATKEILRILSDSEAYDPAVRPSQDGEATRVKIQMLVQDMSLDTLAMRARYDIIFRMRWMDPRLTYRQSDVDVVRIRHPSLLWIPDVYFINADVTRHESIYPEDFIRVTSTGSVVYSIRLTLERNCEMKLQSFPHDTQECHIEMASYGYARDKMDLFLDDDGIRVVKNLDPRLFNLEGFGNSYRIASLSTGDYVSIDVHFKIRRLWSYLNQFYFPVMMLVCISWLSFLLPPEDQSLRRLLLVLGPQMMLSWLCYSYNQTFPIVSYAKAVDIFAGISVCTIFVTLLHLVVFSVLATGNAADKPEVLEEGSNRCVPAALTGRLRLVFRKADRPVCYTIIISYTTFILVYFSFHCS